MLHLACRLCSKNITYSPITVPAEWCDVLTYVHIYYIIIQSVQSCIVFIWGFAANEEVSANLQPCSYKQNMIVFSMGWVMEVDQKITHIIA